MQAVPNVQTTVEVATNAINDARVSYPTTLQNTTHMMAALMSYLYGSMLPALMAQQQRSNITTQDASAPTYPAPSYYSYPSTYSIAPSEHTANERVTRAAPTEKSVTETTPENPKELPLHIMKHAVHHHKKTVTVANSTSASKPVAVELPIMCPKCGAKMKLQLSLTEAQPQGICTCEDSKRGHFCEYAQPHICAICNKIRKYTDLDAAHHRKQQPQSIIILRKMTPQENAIMAPVQPTISQPSGYDGSRYSWGTEPAVESSITKRYAIVPNESYEHQHEIANVINAVYGAAEHEPTCYCWRCRFLRK